MYKITNALIWKLDPHCLVISLVSLVTFDTFTYVLIMVKFRRLLDRLSWSGWVVNVVPFLPKCHHEYYVQSFISTVSTLLHDYSV